MITQDNLSSILLLITPQIIQILMDNKGLDEKEAARLLYNSELYNTLEIEETKLWHLSAPTLYTLLDEELTTGRITWPEEQS
jgi:hypothetical protein